MNWKRRYHETKVPITNLQPGDRVRLIWIDQEDERNGLTENDVHNRIFTIKHYGGYEIALIVEKYDDSNYVFYINQLEKV